jgi:transposase
MGKRSKCSATQQQEAVLMLLRREEPAAVLARRYGVSENTLYKWREKFVEGGQAALANGQGSNGASARQIQELERAVMERDRVVGELTIANRILKKTADRLY